jgi:tRNA pseudouridine38-40 synthase
LTQRYFIQLSYKGTHFYGWQKQANSPSVQSSVEKALSVLLKQPIDIVGAGRTDTGVHASYYIAHFDAPFQIADVAKFIYQLNRILPYDIAIQSVFEVGNDSHARFQAISRSYEYHCHLYKDPFLTETSVLLKSEPDISIMNMACNVLMEYSDFTSFCKLHSDNKTNICKVTEAIWRKDGNKLVFCISADRFLRNMVRAVVGTLLEVGYNHLSIREFRNIIESKNRSQAGISVPAHGLFLVNVEYPSIIFKSTFNTIR